MVGTAVMQQLPVPIRWANQVQATGDKDAAEEVVQEEAVTKDMADESDALTTQRTYHPSGTSREKWSILARF